MKGRDDVRPLPSKPHERVLAFMFGWNDHAAASHLRTRQCMECFQMFMLEDVTYDEGMEPTGPYCLPCYDKLWSTPDLPLDGSEDA